MRLKRSLTPRVLIATGLLGMAALGIASRFPLPAFMSQDGVQGFLLGLCLGQMLLGLHLMRKIKASRAA